MKLIIMALTIAMFIPATAQASNHYAFGSNSQQYNKWNSQIYPQPNDPPYRIPPPGVYPQPNDPPYRVPPPQDYPVPYYPPYSNDPPYRVPPPTGYYHYQSPPPERLIPPNQRGQYQE